MPTKRLAAVFGALAMMAVAAPALSQQPTPWYAGAEVGQADFGSDDDTAIKVLGGYRLSPTLAAEAAYSLLADRGRTEVSALELVAVASIPLEGQFSFFGKLGLANVEVDTRSGSEDEVELTFGIGLHYDMGQRLGFRAGWQRYDTNEEVDLLSVGFVYRL